MPASDTKSPTVDRFVVRSNRDDEIVIGPLDTRKQADAECTRLTREQLRNWITNGETTAGEPIEPPGYRVEVHAIPDPEARRAELRRELDRIAKEERRGVTGDGDEEAWREGMRQTRETIEGELDA